MIRILSVIGRATIVVAALLMIVGSAVAGYVDAGRQYGFAAFGYGPGVGALIGLVLGIIGAGVILGPLATLYDIRDGVRHLVELAEDEYAPAAPKVPDRQGPLTTRREPKLR
jgi:hypothetical protein